MTTTWRMSALDTLFFRDARPHGATGAAVLGSLFPPSVRTVAGLVRFLIGTSLDADWHRFGATSDGEPYWLEGNGGTRVDLLALIGRHDDYGALRFSGPFLAIEIATGWKRLFPAPRTLLVDGEKRPSGVLQIGAPVDCDLGRLRLPRGAAGQRSAERLWLDAEGYSQVLDGSLPERYYRGDELYDEEPRLGIGRTLAQRTATPGLLYQTRHVRPRLRGRPTAGGEPFARLAVEVGIDAGGRRLPTPVPLARLGGEGRLVEVERAEDAGRAGRTPEPPPPRDDAMGLSLNLLTPADLDGRFMPPGFEPRTEDGVSTWHGTLRGVPLTIHSAAIGNAMREGGWDLAARKPRAVRSLMPAGSAWYATATDDHGRRLRGTALEAVVRTLHGTQLTDDPLGCGQIAAGLFGAEIAPFLENNG